MDTPYFDLTRLERTLATIRRMHTDNPSLHCGAEWYSDEPEQHQFSGGKSRGRGVSGRFPVRDGQMENPFRCTLPVGHAEDHRDGNCCYAQHKAPVDSTDSNPYDAWRGERCSCGTFNCSTREYLDTL